MIKKNAYALLSVIVLLIIFSFLSIKIVQNQTFSTKINQLKHTEIQARIYMKRIKQNLLSNPNIEDNKFTLDIQIEDINSSKIYHIYLKTTDDSHINLYERVLINN